MSHFRTPVQIDEQRQKMHYDSHLLFMGSCFANNIGTFFRDTGFNALLNPFGILYNPLSMARAFERLVTGQNYEASDLIFHNGLWQSFDHHGSFSADTPEACLRKINAGLKTGSQFLKKADYLFITFGTARVYEALSTGTIVANCHKFPPAYFKRFTARQNTIVARFNALLKTLKTINPGLKIVLTVSPVRHWKDGAHGNQISKAILLLVIEELTSQWDHCYYFPAYEILLDDLRDYRFYDTDMLHPSAQAVEYIRKAFLKAWMDQSGHSFINDLSKLVRALNHRPFNPQSASHQNFLRQQLRKLDQLHKKYPNINFTPYFQTLNSQIL